jgi:hypothetical protein
VDEAPVVGVVDEVGRLKRGHELSRLVRPTRCSREATVIVR